MNKKILRFFRGLYFAYIFGISVSKPDNSVKNLFFTSGISYCSRGIWVSSICRSSKAFPAQPFLQAAAQTGEVNVTSFPLPTFGLMPFTLQLVGKKLWQLLLQWFNMKSFQPLSLLLQGNWIFLGGKREKADQLQFLWIFFPLTELQWEKVRQTCVSWLLLFWLWFNLFLSALFWAREITSIFSRKCFIQGFCCKERLPTSP